MKGEGTGVSGGACDNSRAWPFILWDGNRVGGVWGHQGEVGNGKACLPSRLGHGREIGEQGVCRPWQELRGINPE